MLLEQKARRLRRQEDMGVIKRGWTNKNLAEKENKLADIIFAPQLSPNLIKNSNSYLQMFAIS
jgi:hypothetical protein